MRRISIARSAEEMNGLRGAWERLASEPRASLFQRFAWNHIAAGIFAAEQPPFVIASESDSGIAIIPACVDTRQARISLLGEELFDYRDALHIGDPAVLQSAWEAAVSFAVKHCLGFGFHSYRASPSGIEWCGLPLVPFTCAPCALAKDTRCSHPHLEVNFRRLLRAGVTRNRYSGSCAQVVQHIYSLKCLEPSSLFRDPLRMRMLAAMTQSAGDECEVFTLESASTLVAAIVTFRDRNWRCFYTTYFDRGWAKYSPGSTLLNLVMQEALSSGLDCDLMTGDQPYKRRVADQAVQLYRVGVSAEELAGRRTSPAAPWPAKRGYLFHSGSGCS